MKLTEASFGANLTTVTTTAAKNIEALSGVRVSISGITTGTILVEISYDKGATWVTFATLTADGLTAELPPCGRVRCNATVATTIDAACAYGGRHGHLRG